MIIHVCASDGERIGELEENDFRDNLFAGRFPADGYYWHDGMEDWRPVAEYRSLAKTQRISFTPPMNRTVKINVETATKPNSEKGHGQLWRWWRRVTGGKGDKK
jgi:GYF domain 2